MRLVAFRVEMYRSIIDSRWVNVTPLTVIVGKNESGKTTLLRALHKLKPFNADPYSMDSEGPRGRRKERDPKRVACRARFQFTPEQLSQLESLIGEKVDGAAVVEVSRTYGGQLGVEFPKQFFPRKLNKAEIEKLMAAHMPVPSPASPDFQAVAQQCRDDVRRLAEHDDFDGIARAATEHAGRLTKVVSTDDAPERPAEQGFITSYPAYVQTLAQALRNQLTISERADSLVQNWIPTFIYMSDYRAFSGTARLDHVQQRKQQSQPNDEDKTLLMLMKLSGLDLDQEVQKSSQDHREQRQYDLADASATLTRTIVERWKQRRYEVEYRADGPLFYTFVKDERDPSLIKLEERSKGFQWFFSFDLMFMHESGGTFKNCVLLLDEPGLHLHPDAQRDLLKRLAAYAEGNVLIYSTHLPFMIDLREPSRIRVLSETDNGNVVSEDLTQSQPEGKLVLQAALGMSGRASYLVAERNLVVEGVDDFWIVSELSNLLIRSGEPGLPEDVLITPAGGASEAAYIATFMIGQQLQVVVLLDSDHAGGEAADALVKKWLTRYQDHHASVLSLGPAAGTTSGNFAIEDMFPDEFYLTAVEEVYKNQLNLAGVPKLKLTGTDMLAKRVERALAEHEISFNRGSVAKIIRRRLTQMKTRDDLPPTTLGKARSLFGAIRKGFGES